MTPFGVDCKTVPQNAPLSRDRSRETNRFSDSAKPCGSAPTRPSGLSEGGQNSANGGVSGCILHKTAKMGKPSRHRFFCPFCPLRRSELWRPRLSRKGQKGRWQPLRRWVKNTNIAFGTSGLVQLAPSRLPSPCAQWCSVRKNRTTCLPSPSGRRVGQPFADSWLVKT